MKNKQLNFIIPIEIYPFSIIFSFNQKDKKLKKILKKYKIKCKEECTHKDYDGFFLHFENNITLIRLYFYPETPYHLSVLQHEILHAVFYILKQSGIKLSNKSEEAYTYLLENITQKVLKKIKK